MIRSCLPILLLALVVHVGAADRPALTPDDLHGAWELDGKSLTAEQQSAATAAKAVEGFGLILSLRTARVIFSEDDFAVGMWRLDAATPTSATLVVQPKGGEERQFHLTIDGKKMQVAEAPGKLPLIKTR